jgi:alginate O-acetyltransferase complex protein AlgI
MSRITKDICGLLEAAKAGTHAAPRVEAGALKGRVLDDKNGAFLPSDFLGLFILPLLALLCRACCDAWIFMWLMAGALYFGCKWLTFRVAARRSVAFTFPRSLGYWLAWPGMEAEKFLDARCVPPKPRAFEWTQAAATILAGAYLLWGVTPRALPAHPILAGWIGMIGFAWLVHFGLFHVLSLGWRQAGVTASPIMENPVLSRSLGEFWGRRWNMAFNEPAFRFAFRPLARLTSPPLASLMVFGVSGVVHELVLSVPARGGYGWPTAYFLVQGLGLAAQRTKLARSSGLGRGALGWLFTALVTASPVFWLFNPRFITKVVLPMLSALGAT